MARSTGSCVVRVNDVLDGHTMLDLACLDRLYLSGFVQKLQRAGGVVYFLHEHRGLPIASPAVFEQISAWFREGMRRFVQDNHIPVVRFRCSGGQGLSEGGPEGGRQRCPVAADVADDVDRVDDDQSFGDQFVELRQECPNAVFGVDDDDCHGQVF